MMKIQQDFKELLELLNVHNVEFIKNKHSTGRKQDLADLDAPGEE